MIRLFASAVGTVLLSGCALLPSSDERLNDFFEATFQRDLDRSPTRQSRLGIKRDQDQWDDVSEAARLQDIALLREDLAALRRFDPEKLSPETRLSARLFEYWARDRLRQLEWRRQDYLLTQMGGMHTRVPVTLQSYHPIDARADADAYIARLERVGPLMQQVVVELQRQEAAGVQPPRFVYDLVLRPGENLLKGRPFDDAGSDSPLFADFKAKLAKAGFSESDRAALTARAQAALLVGFAGGYRQLIAHLRQAQSRANDDDGVWKLPDGAAFYLDQLQHYTTLPLKPDELHELGLKEVAQIHEEMRGIMRKVGFAGDLPAFFAQVRRDPRLHYPDTDAGRARYIADAEALLAEIRGRQDELFGVKPKAEVIVRPVEAWRAASAAKAFYQSPPPGSPQPGVFYVNLHDMSGAPRYQLPVTLYHEAIPGHHVETVVAHELEHLPRFRRFAGIAAFSEGWGLYSERLPKELGLYRDPYDDFGRLSLSLMRATRLVVDTGLHARRWTRAQAVAYLDANMPSSHSDNQREVDRYIVLPGQATSYYVGMLKILELRERAQRRLGERFDLRAFHDVVLRSGPLPLPMLEDVVDNWIETSSSP